MGTAGEERDRFGIKGRWRNRLTDRQTDRQTVRQTDRPIDRKIDRQTDAVPFRNITLRQKTTRWIKNRTE